MAEIYTKVTDGTMRRENNYDNEFFGVCFTLPRRVEL